MELTDGVHALTLTAQRDDRELVIHPTAVETDRGLLLCDVGLSTQTDALASALGDAGFGFADVTAVVLSHHDGDHAGGLAAVADRADPVVYAHAAAVPFVDGREHPLKTDPDDERYPPVPVDVELQDDVAFRTAAGPMRAVFTPGHAPGHLALYFPDERLLIAADALTASEGELQGPLPSLTPDPVEATRSVGRLSELDVEAVHCYHGGTLDAGADAIERVYDDLRAEHGV